MVEGRYAEVRPQAYIVTWLHQLMKKLQSPPAWALHGQNMWQTGNFWSRYIFTLHIYMCVYVYIWMNMRIIIIISHFGQILYHYDNIRHNHPHSGCASRDWPFLRQVHLYPLNPTKVRSHAHNWCQANCRNYKTLYTGCHCVLFLG